MKSQQRTPADLERVVGRISNLPTPPMVLDQINKVISNPRTSAFDIAAILSEDAAMSAKVLRLSNSAYYGMRHEVSSVRQAVVILGLEAIRSLVLSSSVFEMFAGRKLDPVFLDKHWRHSLATAISARLIARQIKVTPGEFIERSFSAGLLHDVGRLIMSAFFPEDFDLVNERADQTAFTSLQMEDEILSYNHSDLGALFAEHWKLPSQIVNAIRYHHYPLRATEHKTEVCLIHIADCVAHSTFTETDDAPSATDMIIEEVYERLGISAAQVECLQGPLQEEYGKAETFLRMAVAA